LWVRKLIGPQRTLKFLAQSAKKLRRRRTTGTNLAVINFKCSWYFVTYYVKLISSCNTVGYISCVQFGWSRTAYITIKLIIRPVMVKWGTPNIITIITIVIIRTRRAISSISCSWSIKLAVTILIVDFAYFQ
jgi:hypothetical protein